MPCLPRPLKTALRLSLTALALSLAAAGAQAQTASEAELAARLDRLAAELAAVKAQLATLQQQKDQAAAAAPAPAPSAAPTAAVETAIVAAAPATVLTSYAEVNLNHPLHRSQNAQADLRRFVLGVQHRFDEQTKVVSELEVEHGVASADDPGEVEVEQAYVERQLGPVWALRAGLFLMPVGLLNENHEPTAYYGVERNFVETAIIPSTWREGGVQMAGSFDNGLTVQAGLSTGFDLTKWDASSTEGTASPLGSIHQEMALAKARDLALFGAVNWRGVPGLLLGGSVFSGDATQGQAVARSRVTLWDLHARWTPGRWDLAALVTQGSISNTAALNLPLVGSPTPIPARFDGGYLQAAYRLWQHSDIALSPFVRWETYDTASRYADLGPGLTPPAAAARRVWTAGANLQLTPGVVLKADLQRFVRDRDADRFNLGMGWNF
jgi:hypothetical protein